MFMSRTGAKKTLCQRVSFPHESIIFLGHSAHVFLFLCSYTRHCERALSGHLLMISTDATQTLISGLRQNIKGLVCCSSLVIAAIIVMIPTIH